LRAPRNRNTGGSVAQPLKGGGGLHQGRRRKFSWLAKNIKTNTKTEEGREICQPGCHARKSQPKLRMRKKDKDVDQRKGTGGQI